MAIFVIFAWMMEAAVALGIVEPDPKDPDSRAYRVANAVMQCLKEELVGTRLEYLGTDCVKSYPENGSVSTLCCRDGTLYRRREGENTETRVAYLGEDGAVCFSPLRGNSMTIVIDTRTDDGGMYRLEFVLLSREFTALS